MERKVIRFLDGEEFLSVHLSEFSYWTIKLIVTMKHVISTNLKRNEWFHNKINFEND